MNPAAIADESPQAPLPDQGQPESPDPPKSALTLHGPAPHDAARVERTILRDAIVGAVLGAIVCAPLWTLLALIALRNSDTALAPPLAVATGVGVLAGVFLGGSTGTLVGSQTLEHFERETRPKAPQT